MKSYSLKRVLPELSSPAIAPNILQQVFTTETNDVSMPLNNMPTTPEIGELMLDECKLLITILFNIEARFANILAKELNTIGAEQL
jgi:hypothetical protein